ncbi:MAG TPA: efflux RND transporter periplasmic adaptor subunit [Candidatus Acidoferrales bacterium]|jgi:putative peptide zinc metalloprotease protein|nr:efflux RND transporter periplasmic adaptor subunit [Candidatus Acidoferrales bacterium]
MRFGPTSLQVSSLLAKGLKRPKLRTDLRISEQTVAGEISYVVKNRETNSYNRYGATEYQLLSLCDGTRTAAEIAQVMSERDPDLTTSEADVLDFMDSVEATMWERSIGEKNLAVLERIRDERKGRVEQSSALYISFKAWDPDKTLTKLDRYLGWMFTKGFVIFSSFIFVVAIYLLAGDWTRVQQDTSALYSFAGKSGYDIWIFWILLLGLGAVHEFGHGLTCKHFGGEVHQMGFLLIYFTPAFFTDTTDILLFKTGTPRQWVIFAGIWIELVICGLAALVWHFTAPGSLTNDFFYKMMLLSGIQGALVNLNPLIKADGYYALSQFLKIDNLREESFAYLRAWVQKYIFRHDIDLPPSSKRQRRVFFLFGISAVFYSTSLLILMLLFVKNVLVSQMGDEWGYLATLGVIYFFARNSIRKGLPLARAWIRDKRGKYMAWKMTRAQQVGALGLILLVLLPPFSSKVTTDLVLEPGKDARVRALVDGRIQKVFVHEGDEVKTGQMLAVLENPDISADAQSLTQQLALASSNLRNNQDRSDFSQAAQGVRDRARLEQKLSVAQTKVQELEIRAPMDGVVVTSNVDQEAGQYLSAGDEFVRLVDRTTMKARILVQDRELPDVQPGAPAKVKVLPFPYRTYSGRVDKILPAAALDHPVAQTVKLERLGQELANFVAVEMDVPNPDGSLREGMTGKAKITGAKHSIAWQAGQATWRWVRSQFW